MKLLSISNKSITKLLYYMRTTDWDCSTIMMLKFLEMREISVLLIPTIYQRRKKSWAPIIRFFYTMCDSGACFILQVLLNIYDINMNLNNLDITWKYPLLQFEKIMRVVKVKQLWSWKHGRSQRIHPFMTIFEPRDLWNAKYQWAAYFELNW